MAAHKGGRGWRRLWEYAALAQEDARKTLVVAGNSLSAARNIEIAIKETP